MSSDEEILPPQTPTNQVCADADKPIPRDFTEFFKDPHRFRLTKEFLYKLIPIDGKNSLTYNIKMENVAAVEELLLHGVDPNLRDNSGYTTLSLAAKKGNIAMMNLLIKAGALVNAENYSGTTALINAAHFGQIEALNWLLDNRADPNLANLKGTTALLRAAQEGHVEICRALLKAGANVNWRNFEGMSALLLACQRGHAEIVYALIAEGADVNAHTGNGSTALMLAAKRCHENSIEALVSCGVEIHMRDKRGRAASDFAIKRNNAHLLRWLDTEMQLRIIRQGEMSIRRTVLDDLRFAYLRSKLHFCSTEQFVAELIHAVRVKCNWNDCPLDENEKSQILLTAFASSSPSLPYLCNEPHISISNIKNAVMGKYKELLESIDADKSIAVMPTKRVIDYEDWMWVQVLFKAFSLPPAAFENIVDYLPAPPLWSWSLSRMPLRCLHSPQQAVIDMSVIADSIVKETCWLSESYPGELLIMKLTTTPQVMPSVMSYYDVPDAAFDAIWQCSEIQSLRCNNCDVNVDEAVARTMLQATVELYRWSSNRCSALKYLNLYTIETMSDDEDGFVLIEPNSCELDVLQKNFEELDYNSE